MQNIDIGDIYKLVEVTALGRPWKQVDIDIRVLCIE